MSALLLCVATAVFARPAAPVTPIAQASIERYEYWLYPPGVAPGGRQRWGVVTAPTAEEAKQELERRQASQHKWWSWVGARNDAGDDPFSYDNTMGPVEVKTGTLPRVPVGISTTNVWIVSLEEVAARRRAAAELADLRTKLEAAKDTLDTLLPIGTNTKAAADLRGRALFMAGPLADTMAKVREAEATLQASSGYSLADLVYELDEVTVRLRRLVPDAAPTTTPTAPPTTDPTPAAPPTTVVDPGGATVLQPIVEPGQRPAGQTPPPTRVLEPGGAATVTTVEPSGSNPSATLQVVAELNRRLGSPVAGKANDDQLVAYQFDREGFTIRRQVFTGGRFQPAPPERLIYSAISDPKQLFLYKADRQSIAYGDPDVKKFQFRPIVFLPAGTTEEQANQMLEMVRHLVAPDLVPATTAVVGFVPNAPTEQDANAKMDAALADVHAPHAIAAADLLPTVIPEWLRNDLLARVAFVTDAKTLATQYSGKLAEGAQVLDDQGRPATLEQLGGMVVGEQWRAGAPERSAWTVTSYEERAGAVLVTLQASYVGRSATEATDRAVHGAKIHESWAVTPNGPVLNKIRLLRAGTVYRPAPPSASVFATRHAEDAAKRLAESRPQSALTSLEAALRINPENPMLWSQYAHTLFHLGQNQESLGSYRLARDLDPKNATIIANYSAVLRSVGDLPTSVAAAKQAVEVDGTAVWPREALALSLFESKDYKGAAEQYAEAVKLAPTDARLRANYASALFRAGRKKEATTEARAAYDAGFRGHWVFESLGIRG